MNQTRRKGRSSRHNAATAAPLIQPQPIRRPEDANGWNTKQKPLALSHSHQAAPTQNCSLIMYWPKVKHNERN